MHPTHSSRYNYLVDADIAMDDKFLFRIQVLEDQRFIECLDRKNDISYEITLGGEFWWHSRPLRLTSLGHEFVEALNQRVGWVAKPSNQEGTVFYELAAIRICLSNFENFQTGF